VRREISGGWIYKRNRETIKRVRVSSSSSSCVFGSDFFRFVRRWVTIRTRGSGVPTASVNPEKECAIVDFL
jgi:hypothetical protein